MKQWKSTMPLCQAGIGWAFTCSSRGASHKRANRPCQDASALWVGSSSADPAIVAAVADGHGDRRHDLSHVGALIAVQTAVHILTSPVCMDEPSVRSSVQDSPVDGRLAAMFITRWRREVEEDARVRLGEETIASEEELEKVLVRYGTTLLAVSVRRGSIFAARIGDGDIAIVRPGGEIEYPVPCESCLVGTITNSLASRNAISMWRSATIPRGEGGYLLLATDGLSDSFGGGDSHEFQVFLKSLRDRLEEYGVERVARSFPAWLDRYSELGSGDDITIALIAIEPEVAHECQEEARRGAADRDPELGEDARDT